METIVADYLQMLAMQLAGQAYNKTAHRVALRSKLDARTDGSIERKHQNISAILLELRVPWIPGYKPLGNYQDLLYDVVVERMAQDARLDTLALQSVEQPAVTPTVVDYASLLVPAPVPGLVREEPARYERRQQGIKRDYLALETRNRTLGAAGEDFIVAYEQHRLHALGAKHLADRVDRVSVSKGDGLGYDVLSFEPSGRERLIEVKTTAFGREAPFFVSRSELALSQTEPAHFVLCRLFQFRQGPRMFELPGAISDNCRLDPASYVARFC
ncbi:MAG TPA: DUF3883 domain-containing protein [Povalibacter sp.]|uniref:DUF3883 domain-containing protein n=1 Tax=Povalibacter sp. TaxID=1962978 RepID=UPI002B9A2E9C|nr:DUF3883 domain-containing protein [Povalibacter sp.]HMN46653.1 DUF3883 domain-containing protein [Povalibacter sp.]